jgi:hypothetical protein
MLFCFSYMMNIFKQVHKAPQEYFQILNAVKFFSVIFIPVYLRHELSYIDLIFH